jgi:hypothetical protein
MKISSFEDVSADQFIDLETRQIAGLILKYFQTGDREMTNHHPGNLGITISRGYGRREEEVKSRVFAACRWLLNNDYLEETNLQGFFKLSKKGSKVAVTDELLAEVQDDTSSQSPKQNVQGTQNKEIAALDIFISHSSKDIDIAKALINLLMAALNIPGERILCTSVPGHRLRGGISTDEALRKEVHNSAVLIGVITQASLSSAYVLFELGARWGAGRYMVPLLARSLDPSILRGPLTGISALRAHDASDLHQLIDNVAGELQLQRSSAAVYQRHLEALVAVSLPSEAQTVKSGTSREQVELSEEALNLLLASEAGDGTIRLSSADQGSWVRAGSRVFNDESDPAVAAIYKDALIELAEAGLIETENGKFFKLTGRGFKVARALKDL